jgi:ATP-dependent helicase/nuclease subunit B
MTGGHAIWTIAPEAPFLDALVQGVFARYGRNPLTLSSIEIVLPSRRACRSLTQAFLRDSLQAPLLLPRLTALGDLDDDDIELSAAGLSLDLPPAIAPSRRQFLLARLVGFWSERRDGLGLPPAQALALAGELARLVDQVHAERASFDRLADLAPERFAEHWGTTVDFLKILKDSWPEILAAEGSIDPAERQVRLIRGRIAALVASPPATPVIAAGVGTATPDAADLLAAIAALPAGAIVLPGLDREADDALWAAIRADPSHPQNGMASLIEHFGVDRRRVPVWGSAEAAARTILVREMMRPATESHHWPRLASLPPSALDGLTRLDLPGPQEEALTIALLLRSQLERPGATAMLVTPDRDLARRVAAELRRWSIEIDDSGGVPLARTPPGTYLRLLGEAAASGLAPVPLLALLGHPLASCGENPARFRSMARDFDRLSLRGPRPAPGLAGLEAVAKPADRPLIEGLEQALGRFLRLIDDRDVTFGTVLEAHIEAAEALAATDTETGAERLWAAEAGEALSLFIAELADAAPSQAIDGADYPVLFEAALAGRVVRPRWGRHARLQILGTLEARLQSADLVVLGGLNEGTWPAQTGHDPWMSRPMRAAFGLPPLEAAIGQAAHDFASAIMAKEVVMTRAVKVEGTPTVPSRWLLRLETVLDAVGLKSLPASRYGYERFPLYQQRLDEAETVQAAPRPNPCPPVSARPRKLRVSEIEAWRCDPYTIYARHILKLSPLDPLDQDPGVAERGNFIHDALARFTELGSGRLAADALEHLEAAGLAAFGAAIERPGIWAFWWPRFQRIARWFIETESARRFILTGIAAEVTGRLVLPLAAGPFTLTARADRIDSLATGGLAIIDYKTGTLPKAEALMLGLAPQLPLEAAIAEAGGFEDIPAAPVEQLAYWRLTGGDPAGLEKILDDPRALAAEAKSGLTALVETFDDPATPYPSRPSPRFVPRYGDYDHLARVAEWGVAAESAGD